MSFGPSIYHLVPLKVVFLDLINEIKFYNSDKIKLKIIY